jgi:hypothetical protein
LRRTFIGFISTSRSALQLNNYSKATNNSQSETALPAPQPTPTSWSYTTMLGLVVSIGAALLLLNLVIIGCFCLVRLRSKRRQLPPTAFMDSVTDAAAVRTRMTTTKNLKQMLVEVNKTASAESVSSVIDLTRADPTYPSRPTLSLENLHNHVACGADDCVHRSFQDLNGRTLSYGRQKVRDRHPSFHEITV